MAMPQAIVESGRKWPPRRKVAAPSTAAVAPETRSPIASPTKGDPPILVVHQALAYAPMPRKAACPKEMMPPEPVISTRPSATRA